MKKSVLLFFVLFSLVPAFGQSDSTYPALMLDRIFAKDVFSLPATDGWNNIQSSLDVFYYIDRAFRDYKLDMPSQNTWPTEFQVYETQKGFDGTFQDFFGSLDSNLDHLILTQPQIVEICRRYPKLFLLEDLPAFILTKAQKQYYVIEVERNPSGFWTYVRKLADEQVWMGAMNRRIIVPSPAAP